MDLERNEKVYIFSGRSNEWDIRKRKGRRRDEEEGGRERQRERLVLSGKALKEFLSW